MTIKAEFNNVKMHVQAICAWPTCDISIVQEWDHPQIGQWIEEIQLTSDQAEQLIEEIKRAIIQARKLDKEYDDAMKGIKNG